MCISCEVCSTVCIYGIIEKDINSGFPFVSDEKKDYCLRCGHCESFCPQHALTLNYRADEKIVCSNKDGKLNENELSKFVKMRRSFRHFTDKAISKEILHKILDDCNYAPTGGNAQPVEWLIIQDAATVKKIAKLTIDWMRSIEGSDHPIAAYVPMIIQIWDSGTDYIGHNAQHLIFAHIPSEFIEDPTEAIIALTHFDIIAPAYGIGTCWAGFIKMTATVYKPIQEILALPENRKIACPILFGYPKYEIHSIPRRKEIVVEWR